MITVVRVIFIIFGIVMPIFIGLLHTVTHYKELLTPEIRETLKKEIPLLGRSSLMLNIWGLMSFMMGFSFMIIGLLNLSHFLAIKSIEAPSIVDLGIVCLYYMGTVYAARTFKAMPQYYGSIISLICLLTSLTYLLMFN